MNNSLFKEFLLLSTKETFLFLGLLFGLFILMYILQKKKVDFSKRILTGTGIGFLLGLGIQIVSGFSDNPMNIPFVVEVGKWYGLIGNGYMDLIRMLVIPIVMISIIHVIINMEKGANIGKLTRNTIIAAVCMVVIASSVGLAVGTLFQVGSGMSILEKSAEIKEVKTIVDTLRALLPSNPFKAMTETNIIALVIASVFFGVGARRMSERNFEAIQPFYALINALHKIFMSVAMTIIKYMPYAVIPLLANTIAQKGLKSIMDVGIFVIALYTAIGIMFIIQLVTLLVFRINPITYFKKAIPVLLLAFTSRSSLGTLPLTVKTLVEKMDVNEGTASFVAGFGTTAGMQGCSGIFPALLLIFVANVNGIPIDITYILMSIIVITIGSFGIAGIPGTATMSASVTLSGVGFASFFPMITPILAIDPIIDMGRTMLNVSGAMTNTLLVNKTLD